MPQRRITRSVIFRAPALFSSVGKPLPAGSYTVTIVEEEVWKAGVPQMQTLDCLLAIPPGSHPGASQAHEISIDREEMERQAVDERRIRAREQERVPPWQRFAARRGA